MSEQLLSEMAKSFARQVSPYLGSTARINDTFYSYNVVSRAIFRLRQEAFQDRAFTESGFQFLGEASAYLACLAKHFWERRGLEVRAEVRWERSWDEGNFIKLTGSRNRAGRQETLTQDFWNDLKKFLRPPNHFPYCANQLYVFESIVLPSPEALYMFGTVLTQSPHATGNWPRGGSPGGPDEDFHASKELLIDDLHTDCGLPLDHQGMRKLSYWTVFPPYGWQQNDQSNYNLMTLFDQISVQEVLPRDEAYTYLRGLLRSQCLGMRNIGARCLMAFSQEPKGVSEARAYNQALEWRDYPHVEHYLLQCQARIEGDPNKVADESWVQSVRDRNRNWASGAFATEYPVDPAFQDQRYKALDSMMKNEIDQAIVALQDLSSSYPKSWTMKMLHRTVQLNGPDPKSAEAAVRELLTGECPNPEAHLRLGTHLKYAGRRDEAMEVFLQAVEKWPHNFQAVDSCLWLITDIMVS
ncbi:MAG: hypothetical protein KDD70_09910 [Bdellovibrionales bacterium]|nr:hypothetical protein [Bdellovibrionales bacterium]